jgi:hypothetical protein
VCALLLIRGRDFVARGEPQATATTARPAEAAGAVAD